MSSGIYTGLTGLTAFSTGLDNISSNVSNMNTPGYKRKELLFRDTYYSASGSGGDQWQLGVRTAGTMTNYSQGQLQSTNNPTDMAIEGPGYFVLQKDNQTLLTRAGQFSFSADGYLVESASGAHVMSWDGQQSQPINITDHRVNQYAPTTTVTFSDSLSKSAQRHDVANVAVYDSNGNKHVLSLIFTKSTLGVDGIWLVEVRNENNVAIANGEIQFNADGSPMAGKNTVAVNYSYPNVGNLALALNFGTPNSFSGASYVPGGTTSSLRVANIDGHATGFLSDVKVDESGYILLSYSNAQSVRLAHIAVARVQNPDSMLPLSGGLFRPGAQAVEVNGAGTNGVGRVVGSRIEGSNVELSGEFTEMIVIQRGYQAVSQVITAANEMMQQLVQMTKTR